MRADAVVAFLVSLLVQVGYPLFVVLHYRRSTHARWQLFIYGAIVFALFQLFTWLPLSVYLDMLVGPLLGSEMGAFAWLMALALITSLVEEGGRWLGYWFFFPRGGFGLTWRNGVMYALGHATVETLLLIAGLTFVHFLAYLFLSQLDLGMVAQSLGPESSPALEEALQAVANTHWEQPLVVAFERVLALPHQLAWALLVMESRVFRQKRWFGFAVLYHTSVAVIVPGLARLLGFGVAEGANAVMAALSVWIVLKLRAISPSETAQQIRVRR